MATVLQQPESSVAIRQTKMLIDNQWVDSVSGKTFETINPATGEVLAQVAEADAAGRGSGGESRSQRVSFQGALAQDVRLRTRQTTRPAGGSRLKSMPMNWRRSNRSTMESRGTSRAPPTAADHRLLPLLTPAGRTKFRARRSRLMAITSATRAMSRSAWLDKSFPGISRF